MRTKWEDDDWIREYNKAARKMGLPLRSVQLHRKRRTLLERWEEWNTPVSRLLTVTLLCGTVFGIGVLLHVINTHIWFVLLGSPGTSVVLGFVLGAMATISALGAAAIPLVIVYFVVKWIVKGACTS